jgi:hypothetical protein
LIAPCCHFCLVHELAFCMVYESCLLQKREALTATGSLYQPVRHARSWYHWHSDMREIH